MDNLSKIEKFANFMRPLLSWVRATDEVKDFIICQFALESNYGESRLARECNNFSGMRFPLVRIASNCERDVKSGFAKYPDIHHCVVDYFLALQYHKPTSDVWENIKSFQRFIQPWYCPEREYINNISKLFNHLKSLKNE